MDAGRVHPDASRARAEIRQKDRIAIEWLITGTHTGERPELPASGNSIELQGSAFLTLNHDKIVQVSTVFDALALAVQTGAAEAAPVRVRAR
jgi:predicted ester cyclase